jgi:hypothetical protein
MKDLHKNIVLTNHAKIKMKERSIILIIQLYILLRNTKLGI